MSTTRDYLEYLSQKIDIAPVNSEEEYQAAALLESLMQSHGLETRLQDFEAPGAGRLAYKICGIVLFVGVLLAGFLGTAISIVGLLLVLVTVVLLGLDYLGIADLLSGLGPKVHSQNVIGVHRGTGPAVVKGERPIVIVAHYDTPRENLMYDPRIEPYQARLRKYSPQLTAVAALFGLVQAFGFIGAGVRHILWVVAIVAALPLLLEGIAAVQQRFAPCTEGSNDNKSGVAAMLGVMNMVHPGDDDAKGYDEIRARRDREAAERAKKEAEEAAAAEAAAAEAAAAVEAAEAEAQAADEEEGQEESEEASAAEVPTFSIVPDVTDEETEEDVPSDEVVDETESYDDSDATEYAPVPAYEPTVREEVEVERIVGARHGKETLEGLGILPEDCEIVYEEPARQTVRYVEEPEETPYVSAGDEGDYDQSAWAGEENADYEESGAGAAVSEVASRIADGAKSLFGRAKNSISTKVAEYRERRAEKAAEKAAEAEAAAAEAAAAEAAAAEAAAAEAAAAEAEAAEAAAAEAEMADAEEEPADTVDETTDVPESNVDEITAEDDEVVPAEESDDSEATYYEDYADESAEPADEDAVELTGFGGYADAEYIQLDEEEPAADAAEPVDDAVDAAEPEAAAPEVGSSYADEAPAVAEPADETPSYDEPAAEAPVVASADDQAPAENDEYDEAFASQPTNVSEPIRPVFIPLSSRPIARTLPTVEEDSTIPLKTRGTFADGQTVDTESVKDTSGLSRLATDETVIASAGPDVKPQPIAPNDPEWGKSSFKPAVSSVARRAVLFDLPDPSESDEVDPLGNTLGDTAHTMRSSDVAAADLAARRRAERLNLPDPLSDEESPVLPFPAPTAPSDSVPEPMPLKTIHAEGDDKPRKRGRRRNKKNGGWKGGAAQRSDLRIVGEEDDVRVQEDLRESVLGMGDDELIAHDIWFVALGGSYADQAGMKAFLDENRRNIRGCFLINLNCVGAGDLAMLTNEGLTGTRKTDRRLGRLIVQVAGDLHIDLARRPHDWESTDATPAMQQRVRAATVCGLTPHDSFALSQVADDDPDLVDPTQTAKVSELVAELIRRS